MAPTGPPTIAPSTAPVTPPIACLDTEMFLSACTFDAERVVFLLDFFAITISIVCGENGSVRFSPATAIVVPKQGRAVPYLWGSRERRTRRGGKALTPRKGGEL